MARLTKYDPVRECYVIVPDSTTNHIQRLGELEDRDEAKDIIAKGNDFKRYYCPICDIEIHAKYLMQVGFCENCGQRLKWRVSE